MFILATKNFLSRVVYCIIFLGDYMKKLEELYPGVGKDVLIKGNKIYSPNTCSYIPSFINTLLLNCRSARGKYPIGVIKHRNGFMARLCKRGKLCYIGFYNTIEEAFLAHKQAKESYIKEVAQEYFNKGEIDKRVYNALMNYKVEITD